MKHKRNSTSPGSRFTEKPGGRSTPMKLAFGKNISAYQILKIKGLPVKPITLEVMSFQAHTGVDIRKYFYKGESLPLASDVVRANDYSPLQRPPRPVLRGHMWSSLLPLKSKVAKSPGTTPATPPTPEKSGHSRFFKAKMTTRT
jgi:hypothetical protein